VSPKQSGIREALVDALAQSPMLQFLGKSGPSRPELRKLLAESELQSFPPEVAIITEGEESDRMYVLASGTVSVQVDGNEVCVMSEPGEIFGEFGAVTGELRSATVLAVSQVTCLAMSPQFISQKAFNDNGMFSQLVQRALTKILLGRLRQTSSELVATQESLKSIERQVSFLRLDNDTLNNELETARKTIREGLRGTRAGE
jgi:CRP-like cAMP-binding protein